MPHEIYTHSHDQVVVDAHSRRTADEAAAFARHLVRPDMDILDVGCGPGSITCDLARWVPDGHVIGVDVEATVLDAARRQAESAGLTNIAFRAADAYALDFEDESFDLVYAHQLLQHLGRPVEALQEFRRVLKSDGLVAVRDADYGTMTHYPNEPDIDRFFEIYAQVARRNGGEPDAGRRLLSWIREAGFRNPVYTSSSWAFSTLEERKWWADLWAGRTGIAKYVRRVEELGVSTRAELTDLSATFLAWAERPDAVFAFLHGEVVAKP